MKWGGLPMVLPQNCSTIASLLFDHHYYLRMHRPNSATAIFFFRISALLWVSNFLLASVSILILFPSLVLFSRFWIVAGLATAATSVLSLIAQWIFSTHSRCPLCRTPVLSPKNCVRHRCSRMVLGSYRLQVALAILFTNRFRCPFCNESTKLQVRE